MQEWMTFEMQVKKKIPEVMEFVKKKIVDEKMSSYCTGEEAERFAYWCKELEIDKAQGVVICESDVYMIGDDICTIDNFLEDLAKNVPDAQFKGNASHSYGDLGVYESIDFEMKKGSLSIEDTTRHSTYGYGYDEYDEEDYDEEE